MCRNGHKDVFQTFCSWMREGRWAYCVSGLARKSFGPTSEMGTTLSAFFVLLFLGNTFLRILGFQETYCYLE